MRFNYLRTTDLNGDKVHIVMSYGDMTVVGTGACSLRMVCGVGNLGAMTWQKAKQELDYIIKELDGNEPMNLLAYVQTHEKKAIEYLEKFGFFLIETLPGGHDKYEMALMCYMHNADMFTEERDNEF